MLSENVLIVAPIQMKVERERERETRFFALEEAASAAEKKRERTLNPRHISCRREKNKVRNNLSFSKRSEGRQVDKTLGGYYTPGRALGKLARSLDSLRRFGARRRAHAGWLRAQKRPRGGWALSSARPNSSSSRAHWIYVRSLAYAYPARA